MRELAGRGWSDRQIGEVLDPPVGPDAVRAVRRNAGIPPGVPPGGSSHATGWERVVTELWRAGLTTAEIAARSGYTVRTVQQRLYELGLRAVRP